MSGVSVIVIADDAARGERCANGIRAAVHGRAADVSVALAAGGAGASINACAAAAKGATLAFFRAYCEPRADWIDAVLAALEANDAPIVLPRIVDAAGGRLRSASGAARDGAIVGMLGGAVATHPLALVPRNVDLACTGSLALRRSTFDELGGFDGAYRAAFLETDLCLRSRVRGGRLAYRPDFVVREAATAPPVPLEDARVFLERWATVFTPPLILERMAG